MGCLCSKERIVINGKPYYVKENLGEGYLLYIQKITIIF